VAANGTGGTDHGTGAVAMLIGGAVQGGRIVADWPGLSSANLLEGRDLKPTLALDALVTAACAESFALEQDRISKVLFPFGAAQGKPVARLLRA
jgi:uncharacterized protein (DUF1501 family)